MSSNIIDNSTIVASLTLGQLESFLVEIVKKINGQGTIQEINTTTGEFVKGILEIANRYGVSRSTAIKYKDGKLHEAIKQEGRVIILDCTKGDKIMGYFIGKNGEKHVVN